MTPSQKKTNSSLLANIGCKLFYRYNYLKYYIVSLTFWTPLLSSCQVGIGTDDPHPSAKLEVKSSIHGFLLPRHTTVQRQSISHPAAGLQVFDLDTSTLWYFNGQFWVELSGNSTFQSPKEESYINSNLYNVIYLDTHVSPITTVAGMIYFDGTNFVGYNGKSWVQLNNNDP